MRVVAFGILAGMIFGAGCALQAGDPGEAGGVTSTDVASTPTPKVRMPTVTQPASSAYPNTNPQPQPWVPAPGDTSDSTQLPQPSPWHSGPPVGPSTDPGQQSSSSTAPAGTVHVVGHWTPRSNLF